MTIAEEGELNMFRNAADHVKGGAGKRTFSCSDGWAMVRAGRLVELEIAEECLGVALTALKAEHAAHFDHAALAELRRQYVNMLAAWWRGLVRWADDIPGGRDWRTVSSSTLHENRYARIAEFEEREQ